MFEDFLNHTCNIYHTEDDEVTPGYGIKAQTVKKFGTTPSVKNVPCHFYIKSSSSLRLVQNEPFTSMQGEDKLALPFGTDIRENDVVEDCVTGVKFRAGVPKPIHGNHHIVVTLEREGGVRSAI